MERFVSSCGGEDDGGGNDEASANPGAGAEAIAEHEDAEDGAERRFDVEEDAGARSGNTMHAPVPEEGGGRCGDEAADGNGAPDSPAEAADRGQAILHEHPGKEHGGAGEQGPAGDGEGRASAKDEPLIEQDPSQGDDEGQNDEQIAPEIAAVNAAVGAGDDEGDAGGGSGESEPAFQVEALMSKERGAGGEDHGHGADHERRVADGGELESFKLHHELQGDAEESADEDEVPLVAGELRFFEDGEQAQAGEEESIEDVVADVEAGEGDFSEEEAGAPAAAGESAGDIADGASNALAMFEGRVHAEAGGSGCGGVSRRLRHFSPRKRRMAAMPAAPACTQAEALFR